MNLLTRVMRYGLMVCGAVALMVTAPPAEALSLPGCGVGEFLFYTQGDILFENGPVNITGNIFSLTGKIQVGAHNIIHGTVSAANLFVGTGAVVDVCATNNKTGNGTCGSVIPFAPEAACTFPPLPVPTFPAVCSPGTDFTAVADTTLAPGCYNKIRTNAGVTLTLDNGADYFAKGEVRVLNGGTFGAGPGAPANLTTKSVIVSEANAIWQNMNVTTLIGIGNAINPGNSNIFVNVQMYAPFGGSHPHNGSRLDGTTEFISKTATIEPISNTPPPGEIFCVCPPGTVLAGEPTLCIPIDLQSLLKKLSVASATSVK